MKRFINKNHFGDCIEVMKQFPKGKINLILTDPPYNASNGGVNLPNNKTGGAYFKVNEKWDQFKDYNSYMDFTRMWIYEADKLLAQNGSIMICSSMHNIGEVIYALKEKGYKLLNIITWKKSNPMPSIAKRTLTYSTEFIVWFSKGKGWTFNYNNMKKYNQGKQLRDVWEFSVCQGPERIKGEDNRAAHPTQKPLALFKRLVEMASKENDVILDPFMGIGTTAVASIELKRNWVGIEQEKKYVSLANKRIEKIKKNNETIKKDNI